MRYAFWGHLACPKDLNLDVPDVLSPLGGLEGSPCSLLAPLGLPDGPTTSKFFQVFSCLETSFDENLLLFWAVQETLGVSAAPLVSCVLGGLGVALRPQTSTFLKFSHVLGGLGVAMMPQTSTFLKFSRVLGGLGVALRFQT